MQDLHVNLIAPNVRERDYEWTSPKSGQGVLAVNRLKISFGECNNTLRSILPHLHRFNPCSFEALPSLLAPYGRIGLPFHAWPRLEFVTLRRLAIDVSSSTFNPARSRSSTGLAITHKFNEACLWGQEAKDRVAGLREELTDRSEGWRNLNVSHKFIATERVGKALQQAMWTDNIVATYSRIEWKLTVSSAAIGSRQS